MKPHGPREERVTDLKLEVVPIPVSDVDAAKDFYTRQVGLGLDHDVRPNEGMRVVQMSPPGSACSVVIGVPVSEAGQAARRRR
jgi:predicted enzyme related to lactoylglutathione lyase